MFTWVHDQVAVHSPLLLATSPEPECGKSTLLGVLGFLVRRSLLSVNITGPALFRSIAKWQATFVIDEADTTLVNNEDLKEVINSGWTRGQGAIRCDPDTKEVEEQIVSGAAPTRLLPPPIVCAAFLTPPSPAALGVV